MQDESSRIPIGEFQWSFPVHVAVNKSPGKWISCSERARDLRGIDNPTFWSGNTSLVFPLTTIIDQYYNTIRLLTTPVSSSWFIAFAIRLSLFLSPYLSTFSGGRTRKFVLLLVSIQDRIY